MKNKILISSILVIFMMRCNLNEAGLISPDQLSKREFFTKSKNGLVSDLITTMYTDTKDNIWIGTTSGLSKYNGSTFTNYTTSNGPLTNNWILSILEDKDDNIIVGTKSGLNLFDGMQWFYFPLFVNIEVNALVEASNGDVWVGTSGYGTVQLYYAGGYKQHFDNACTNCNFVNTLFKDSNGTLWLGSDAGIKSFNGSFKSYSSLTDQSISSIRSDHWGNLWFGLFDSKSMFRYVNSKFEEFPMVSFASFNWARAMAEDRNGLLWIAADYGGLIYFDGAVSRQVVDLFPQKPVTAITFDKNGVLWVGSEGNGVARFFPLPK